MASRDASRGTSTRSFPRPCKQSPQCAIDLAPFPCRNKHGADTSEHDERECAQADFRSVLDRMGESLTLTSQ